MNIAALSLLTYTPESTPGVAPADAAAWISDGIRLRHLGDSLDVSGVERQQLEDMRNQYRVKGTEARVEGLDNPECSFAVYGHGIGAETAAGAQVADDAPGYELANLLGHALGGLSRGYATQVNGGTSTITVIAVDDAADFEAGDFVGIEFATPPTGYPAGTIFPRRVIATDDVSSPNTLTLDQALPQAPVDNDQVHGGIVVYIDENVLADSAAAADRTRSWLVQKGMPGAGSGRRESWVFRGSVATLQAFTFERGGLMQFAFQVMASSHLDPTDAPWPTAWADNVEQGLAPLSVGPLTEVWLVDRGSSTNTRMQVSRFEVEPGVPRVRVETLTSAGEGMQGTAGFAVQPAETTINMRIDPFSVAQWTDQTAGTHKTLRWARLGPAGSCMAVHFPRVSHIATPKRDVNNATTGVGVMFKAHEDVDLVSMPSNTERWRSAMQIVLF